MAKKNKTQKAKNRTPADVYKAIQLVQQKIRTVIKLGVNEFHHYKYAYEKDYIAEVKPLLAEAGLVITPDVKEYRVEPIKDGSFMGYVFVNFTIRHPQSKTSVTIGFPGQGEDKGDKSLPKALTMATKYFLAKTFLVETQDDAEQDRGQKKSKQDPAEVFEVAKKGIMASRNIAGLIEYDEKMMAGKTFNKTQKAELHKLVQQRVTQLDGTAKG